MQDPLERHRKAVELDPGNELAQFALGKGLFDQGNFAEARGHLQAAVKNTPDWMAAWILLGRCELNMGDKDSARVTLERARVLAEDQGHVGPLEQVSELMKQLAG